MNCCEKSKADNAKEIDNEYLSRPLIEGVVFVIEDKYLRIFCPHTLFIDCKRHIPVAKNEVLSLYQSVLRKAKEKNAKISYTNHWRKKVTESWTAYESDCIKEKTLFSEITAKSKLVQARGIHVGCADDATLAELTRLQNEHRELFYRNKVVHQISYIHRCLKELDSTLDSIQVGSSYAVYL